MRTHRTSSYAFRNSIPHGTTSGAYRPFALLVLLFLLGILFLLSLKAGGEETAGPTAPMIWITPSAGPPTSRVLVSGSGFDPYAAVDVYFDLTDLALTVTDGKGGFGTAPSPNGGSRGIPIAIPKDALPGTHWITAVERYGIKAAQTQFLVRADWAHYQFGPDRKGFNPYEGVLNPDTVGGLRLHWAAGEGGMVGGDSAAVANGVIYFGGEGTFEARNASTGAKLWVGIPGIYFSAPAIADGLGFVTSWSEGCLYAFNPNTGQVIWKNTTGADESSSPAVANSVVYFGSQDGNLYALNARTGALLWKYTGASGSPAVANGIVYATSDKLYALAAGSGALLWEYPTGGTPAVANGVVYINGLALNAKTGLLLWQNPTVSGTPAVANGVVYFGSSSGDLYALNAGTGTLLWQYPGPTGTPVVANGVVYFEGGSFRENNLYALSASSGLLLWSYQTNRSAPTGSPIVVNGFLYSSAREGLVYAFDLSGNLAPDKLSPPEPPDPALLIPNYSLKLSAIVTSSSSESN
jgi:outer membrane protein assembly factor BamB